MSYQCLNEERKIYVKKESSKAINNLARIIFDFDGVLVYVVQSYYENIRKVVDYYFLEILGLEGKRRKLVTLSDIQDFKDTGLFNNDWTLTHAIIIYYLTILIGKLRQKHVLDGFLKQYSGMHFSEANSFIQTLRRVGGYCRRHGVNAMEFAGIKKDRIFGIESLLAQVRTENQPFEAVLTGALPRAERSQMRLVKEMIPYSVEKPDLVKRLFEESYLGGELFKRFYGISPIFNFSECLLDKEEFIPTIETFRKLHSRFGKLAVYSEKSRSQAIYLLEKNGLSQYFDENELIFLEDLIKSEDEQLGKPNPNALVEMVEKSARAVGKVAYIGDTIADALLVKNAHLKGLPNLLFLGVLCSSKYPDRLLSQFMNYQVDAIMTDVNDIPYLYASLGGEI